MRSSEYVYVNFSDITPLGYRAEQLPHLDVQSSDVEDNNIASPDGFVTNVYGLTGHPEYVVRTELLSREGRYTPDEVAGHIADTSAEFNRLAAAGITILPHRYLHAYIEQRQQGWSQAIALAPRIDRQDLLPDKPGQLESSLKLVESLAAYIKGKVNDSSPDSIILWDVFKLEQFSVVADGQTVLHDVGLRSGLVNGYDGKLRFCLKELMKTISEVDTAAQGSVYEHRTRELQSSVGEMMATVLDGSHGRQ